MDVAVDPALHVAGHRSRVLADGLTIGATILGILAIALLPLLTPWAMHAALDAAQSAAWLGTDAATAHALSDRTVDELLFGPGSFSFQGPGGTPFYHRRGDRPPATRRARCCGCSSAWPRSPCWAWRWRSSAAAGPPTSCMPSAWGAPRPPWAWWSSGVVGLVAFEPLFELFHRVFFPGGNWAFDPRTERLVQLYPYAFWQVTAAALGLLAMTLGVLVWLAARLILGPDPDRSP